MKLIIIATLTLVGCGAASVAVRPTAYGAELEECNRTATTLEASIACENGVRVRYGRPPRALPVTDGGAR